METPRGTGLPLRWRWLAQRSYCHRWDYATKLIQTFIDHTSTQAEVEKRGEYALARIKTPGMAPYEVVIRLHGSLEEMRDASLAGFTLALERIMRHRLGTGTFIRTKRQWKA